MIYILCIITIYIYNIYIYWYYILCLYIYIYIYMVAGGDEEDGRTGLSSWLHKYYKIIKWKALVMFFICITSDNQVKNIVYVFYTCFYHSCISGIYYHIYDDNIITTRAVPVTTAVVLWQFEHLGRKIYNLCFLLLWDGSSMCYWLVND